MNQEFLQELQRFYSRLETRSGELFHALFHRVFQLELGWYSGHYQKNKQGSWIYEIYPVPVIEVKGFCDIENIEDIKLKDTSMYEFLRTRNIQAKFRNRNKK